jgi:hypothetical protein
MVRRPHQPRLEQVTIREPMINDYELLRRVGEALYGDY